MVDVNVSTKGYGTSLIAYIGTAGVGQVASRMHQQQIKLRWHGSLCLRWGPLTSTAFSGDGNPILRRRVVLTIVISLCAGMTSTKHFAVLSYVVSTCALTTALCECFCGTIRAYFELDASRGYPAQYMHMYAPKTKSNIPRST
jgi:hypothetical protein